MRVLGIEGTAWMASAAVYDTETDEFAIESDAYTPDGGGIHPREAAEHMADAVPQVVSAVLKSARDEHGADAIDVIAFSRGPGLGPCLRVVATAARTLAGRLDTPLVGVNHMIAHAEIGRHRSKFDDPICLNASGANAHLLAYRGDRYRVLGETMDTGIGNAIDKFARSLGWDHPGGPKVESRAGEGSFHDLPYVVKGMDFSFAGLSTAATEAVEDGIPVEDVCFALQEHAFGTLAEVSERALSLTGRAELVLGGGVGQNDRLQQMLREMCAQRDVEFFTPEPRFLRDNAGMIALVGARMAAAGDTLDTEDSAVKPGFRPDDVRVSWRDRDLETDEAPGHAAGDASGIRGAEATVELRDDVVIKRRVPKEYRHPKLDDRLRRERTVAEARLLRSARRAGVPTPLVRDIDRRAATLRLQKVGETELRTAPSPRRARTVGGHLATLHDSGLVHGDPTVRNVMIGSADPDVTTTSDPGNERLFLIDFGLGSHSGHVEDQAMDLHVFRGSLTGVVDTPETLLEAVLDGYRAAGGVSEVLDRLQDIEQRGRYQ